MLTPPLQQADSPQHAAVAGVNCSNSDGLPNVVSLGDARGSLGGSFVSTMENSLASSFANTGSRKTAKKRLSAEKKLEEINKQLAAIRKEREESSSKKSGRVLGKRTDYSKRPKKSFHHPNLEYVMGELIYSPYRTHPLAKYPEETFRMNDKLKDLRKSGCKFDDLPEQEKPYDVQQVRKSFVKEIANYNPGFNIKAVSWLDILLSHARPFFPLNDLFLVFAAQYYLASAWTTSSALHVCARGC